MNSKLLQKLRVFVLLLTSQPVLGAVVVEIIDGITNNSLKSNIEANASRFFNETNHAFAQPSTQSQRHCQGVGTGLNRDVVGKSTRIKFNSYQKTKSST